VFCLFLLHFVLLLFYCIQSAFCISISVLQFRVHHSTAFAFLGGGWRKLPLHSLSVRAFIFWRYLSAFHTLKLHSLMLFLCILHVQVEVPAGGDMPWRCSVQVEASSACLEVQVQWVMEEAAGLPLVSVS